MRLLALLVLLGPALALRLATTTSVYDSGLLDRLLEAFLRETGIRVQVLAVGTGQALRLAERKDVDAVLVHAPSLEREALARGITAEPYCLAQNAFLLAGPEADPAQVREAENVLEALRRIAAQKAPFVSRGDRSGTHLKELELWEKAGLKPQGPWYLESGAGMGQTLVLAAEKGAYTLTDLATFLTVGKRRGLKALYAREDPLLLNQYAFHLVPGSPGEGEAQRLRAFLASEEAARIVAGLRVEGTPSSPPFGAGAPSPCAPSHAPCRDPGDRPEKPRRGRGATLLAALFGVPLGLWLALRGVEGSGAGSSSTPGSPCPRWWWASSSTSSSPAPGLSASSTSSTPPGPWCWRRPPWPSP